MGGSPRLGSGPRWLTDPAGGWGPSAAGIRGLDRRAGRPLPVAGCPGVAGGWWGVDAEAVGPPPDVPPGRPRRPVGTGFSGGCRTRVVVQSSWEPVRTPVRHPRPGHSDPKWRGILPALESEPRPPVLRRGIESLYLTRPHAVFRPLAVNNTHTTGGRSTHSFQLERARSAESHLPTFRTLRTPVTSDCMSTTSLVGFGDADSFYASAEAVRRPWLAGLPSAFSATRVRASSPETTR